MGWYEMESMSNDVTAIQKGFITIESIDNEALASLDSLKRQELLKWSKSSQSKHRILSMISMASKHEDMLYLWRALIKTHM